MRPSSTRLPPVLTPTPLAERLEAARARARDDAGPSLVDLTSSNPTAAGFSYPVDALAQALASPQWLTYEPSALGHPRAREAICEYYRDAHSASVSPCDVLVTASTSEGYAQLFALLCDAGDRVLVPAPSYPLFEHLAALSCVAVDRYALAFDGGFHIDLDALAEEITPRTRAIVLVSPNNPTGSYLRASDHRALESLCAARGLALICDEVFTDYPLERSDETGPVRTLAASRTVPTFVLSGLSKIAALPQMKLGWIVLAGDDDARAFYRPRAEFIADTFLSASAVVQCAAPALLALRHSVGRAVHARCQGNLAALRALVDAAPDAGTTVLPVEAGWSAVLRVPALESELTQVLTLAERDRVLVQPGFFYDFAREAHLVVSLLARPDEFTVGIARILARQRAFLAAP